jgi:phenylglyoxylate dehydrogenase epsilon subunit
MAKRKHLMIGCGSASLSALEQIRRLNSEDEIRIVTMEDFSPYSPSALPYFLSGKIDESDLPMRDKEYFDRMKAAFVSGRKVTQVLPETKQVVYQDGEKENYDTLLIASGSEATKPSLSGLEGNDFLGIHTLDDCRRLLNELTGKTDVTILGAGLVGVEVAVSLVDRGLRVTIIEKEPSLLPLYFDPEAGEMIKGIFLDRGVRLLTGRTVRGISRKDGKIEVSNSRGDPVITDVLVTCVGVKARTSFITGAGIAVNRGILVDRRMRTNIEDIYAAGDVAETPEFFTGNPGLNPILPSAVGQGTIAGSNMAGKEADYEGWLPMNILNLFGHRALSIGTLDGNGLQILTDRDDRKKQYRKLVLKDGRLVGAAFIDVDVIPGTIQYLISKRINVGQDAELLLRKPKETSARFMLDAERKETVSLEI